MKEILVFSSKILDIPSVLSIPRQGIGCNLVSGSYAINRFLPAKNSFLQPVSTVERDTPREIDDVEG